MSQNKVADFFADLEIKIKGLKELRAFEAKLDQIAAKSKSLEKALSIKPSSSIKAATKDQDTLGKSVSRTTGKLKQQGNVYQTHLKQMEQKAQDFNRRVSAITTRHAKPGKVADFKRTLTTVNKTVNEVVNKSKPRIRISDGKIVEKPDTNQDLKTSIRERLSGVQAQGVAKLSRLESALSQSRIKQAADVAKAEADAKAASYKAEATRQKYLKAAQAQYQKDMEKVAKAESKAKAQVDRQEQTAQKRAIQAQIQRNRLLKDEQTQRLRSIAIASAEFRGIASRVKLAQANKLSQGRQALQAKALQEKDLRLKMAASRLEAVEARTRMTLDRTSKGIHNSPLHAYVQGFQAKAISMGGSDSYGLLGAASGVARFSGALGPAGVALGVLAAAAVGAGAAMNGLINRGTGTVNTGDEQKAILGQFTATANGNQDEGAKLGHNFLKFADELGIRYRDNAPEYAKGLRGLKDGGMKVSQGEKLLNNFLSYSKANGLSDEHQKLALNAIQQALSKRQLMSEEWKTQLAERVNGLGKHGAIAYAQLRGVKIDPNNDKQVGDAFTTFSKDMESAKIKGETLIKFLGLLSERLGKYANEGGLLDSAKQSHVSMTNRLDNEKLRNEVISYTNDDGAISSQRRKLDEQLIKLEQSYQPLEVGLGILSGKAMDAGTELGKFAEALAWWAARFVPGYGYASAKEAPRDAKESLERSKQLATLKVTDEKDPTRTRDAGLFEQRNMYVDFVKEQRRLRGGVLSEREEAFAIDRAVTTPADQLRKEMKAQLVSQEVRERSLKLVDYVNRASDSLNRSVEDRPSPLDPRVNIESETNAMRLLKGLATKPESPTYYGQVDRTGQQPQQVTNRTENSITIAPGAIVVNGSDNPIQTAQAIQEALRAQLLDTAAGIGAATQ